MRRSCWVTGVLPPALDFGSFSSHLAVFAPGTTDRVSEVVIVLANPLATPVKVGLSRGRGVFRPGARRGEAVQPLQSDETNTWKMEGGITLAPSRKNQKSASGQ